ncbi:MAG: hypothetical protein IJV76_10755, partial [Clostridia bacterium]|nr:hypothetical protein [Clostridia bacterium]
MGKEHFEKSSFPKPHLQKLLNEMDGQGWVQIWNTLILFSLQNYVFKRSARSLSTQSFKVFWKGFGETFLQKG